MKFPQDLLNTYRVLTKMIKLFNNQEYFSFTNAFLLQNLSANSTINLKILHLDLVLPYTAVQVEQR